MTELIMLKHYLIRTTTVREEAFCIL